jgi:hypothetical protein
VIKPVYRHKWKRKLLIIREVNNTCTYLNWFLTMVCICRNKSKYAYQESPHWENTASPRSKKEEREFQRERMFIRILFSNKTPQTKKRTLGITALERSVEKHFATGGLNQVLGCTNITCPKKFSYQQTSTSCLSEITPTHPSA